MCEVKLKMREEWGGLFVKVVTCYSLVSLAQDVLELHRASIWSSDFDVESRRRALFNSMLIRLLVTLSLTFFLRTCSHRFIANVIHI